MKPCERCQETHVNDYSVCLETQIAALRAQVTSIGAEFAVMREVASELAYGRYAEDRARARQRIFKILHTPSPVADAMLNAVKALQDILDYEKRENDDGEVTWPMERARQALARIEAAKAPKRNPRGVME